MGLIQRAKTLAYAFFAFFGMHPKEVFARQPRPTSQLRNAEFSLTIAQVRRVIASATSPRDALMIRLFAETGIRRFELVDLRWDDIAFERKVLVVRNGKGAKMRLIPMTTETVRLLLRQCPTDTTSHVFASRQSRKLSIRQVNRIVANAGVKAGVLHPNPRHTHLTCHLFRHTFARQWKAHGGSIETLSMLMGHESQRTTLDVYGRESFTEMQDNYQSLMNVLYSTRKPSKDT